MEDEKNVLVGSIRYTMRETRDVLEDVVWVRGREAESSPTSAWEAPSKSTSSWWSASAFEPFFAQLIIYLPFLLLRCQREM